jgi:hypothetical protein
MEQEMKTTCFWLISLVIGASACSGSASDEATRGGDGTTEGGTPIDDTVDSKTDGTPSTDDTDGWPEALLEADGCVVASVAPGSETRYVRRSFDAAQRLITETPVDEEGTDIDDPDPHLSQAQYYQLDAAGRLLLKAGGGGGYRPFRHDYIRDARGNVTQGQFRYGDTLELEGEPSGDVYSWTTYTNGYDVAGQLVAHTVAGEDKSAQAGSRTFTHDAQGRCATTTTTGGSTGDEAQHNEYDEVGHLIRLTLETARFGLSSTQVSTLSYDALGRLVLEERDGGGYELPAPVDGVPDARTVTRYFPDGRKSVDTVSFTSDQVNDTAVFEGTSRDAYHSTEFASAACADLEAAIPKVTSQACIADW